ncbi:MAG TPA: inorganic diphosphatase [Gammaproteobacteria bacterium]|nr:inorganic diphosphatase [Gammaproteobacteria bacterium]HAU07051.1 inorganic diphosphatase [Gammaproteobacteria bacterium]
MNLDRVSAGNAVPDDIHVIIEIPANSDPVKYEVDKATGALFVDRLMNTAMFYPCNYGYVPQTLSEDGDPVDVLVITPYPLISGCVVSCRPVGMLDMTDESGKDAKIIAVPHDKMYDTIQDIDDVSDFLKGQLSHFFEHYKDLEKNKWVKVDAWENKTAAQREITASVARYQAK